MCNAGWGMAEFACFDYLLTHSFDLKRQLAFNEIRKLVTARVDVTGQIAAYKPPHSLSRSKTPAPTPTSMNTRAGLSASITCLSQPAAYSRRAAASPPPALSPLI